MCHEVSLRKIGFRRLICTNYIATLLPIRVMLGNTNVAMIGNTDVAMIGNTGGNDWKYVLRNLYLSALSLFRNFLYHDIQKI